MVEDQDCAAGFRDIGQAIEGDVGVGRHDLGAHERTAPLLDLAACNLDDTFVLVEVADRPAFDGGGHGQVRIRIDCYRVPNEVKHG